MIGILFGLACGAAELVLLRILVKGITGGGKIPVWTVPAKMLVLAAFLVPCGFIAPGQLYLAGIAAAVILIAGALVLFWRQRAGASRTAERGDVGQ